MERVRSRMAAVSLLDDAAVESDESQSERTRPADRALCLVSRQVKYLHQLFEEQAKRSPSLVAVEYERQTLSYHALNESANKLAHFLRERGVGPETLVAVCMERCIDMVVSLLGILKAGAAYVPIDPSHPKGRLEYLLADCAPQLILTQDHLKGRLSTSASQAVVIEETRRVLSRYSSENISPAAIGLHPRSLAYVIYTSGSTGNPKGAMNEHGGVINRLVWMQDQYGLRPEDRVLQKTPFGFDVSVWEFFWTTMTGARLVVARPEGHRDPRYLMELIEDSEVTTLHFVPSMLQLFLDTHEPGRCPTVRHVVCSGEELPVGLQSKFFERFPAAALSNLYGPTEAAVDVTAWECGAGEGQERVPIGFPIANTQMHVLSDTKEPLLPGEQGHLFIGGVGVGRGYWKRPDLTCERFVADPFSSAVGTRMYDTGDLGRLRADGALEYLGRGDGQIKLHGIRIELGEVEGHLRRHAGVKEAAVMVRENDIGEKRLAAYVTADMAGVRSALDRDAGESGAHIVQQWRSLYEETYASDSDEPSFAGWNSSYTGRPLSEREMREWVERTVARIGALRPRRMLEVGCGLGLLMRHLAPTCDLYWGTDISSEAIERLQRWVRGRPEFERVKFTHGEAVSANPAGQCRFDTIVLNSVIQYFPSEDYLYTTIQSALNQLSPGGSIYIGDVRNLRLLSAFHASVQVARSGPEVRIGTLRDRVARAIELEKELVVDPEFFEELIRHFREIQSVSVNLKRSTCDNNELTRYRYDVVLSCAEPPHGAVVGHVLKLVDPTVEFVERHLAAHEARTIIVAGVENERLYSDLTALRWINESDKAATVASIRERLGQLPLRGVDPESFYRLGDIYGYETSVTWSAGEPGRFDVIYRMPYESENAHGERTDGTIFPGSSET